MNIDKRHTSISDARIGSIATNRKLLAALIAALVAGSLGSPVIRLAALPVLLGLATWVVFSIHRLKTTPAPYTFGNAGRNTVFTDGTANVDCSIRKNTSLSETRLLEFRAEFFNFSNNTNFDGAPGRIYSTPNFGRYCSAENPRQVQLGLKYIF